MPTPTTYERTFEQFTVLTENVPDVDSLITAIGLSPIVPGIDYAAQAVTVSEAAQKVFFSFKDTITEAYLDALVAAHTGVPEVVAQIVELNEEHDSQGVLKTAPAHKLVSETYRNVGYRWSITAGQVNCFDVQIGANLVYLAGGTFAVDAATKNDIHIDDYAEFAVVDKDDVLGLFATYGLTVGVDVLELKKYVITHFFLPDDKGVRHHIEPGTLAQVAPGLYLRACFDSHGSNDLTFYVWYDWFET